MSHLIGLLGLVNFRYLAADNDIIVMVLYCWRCCCKVIGIVARVRSLSPHSTSVPSLTKISQVVINQGVVEAEGAFSTVGLVEKEALRK